MLADGVYCLLLLHKRSLYSRPSISAALSCAAYRAILLSHGTDTSTAFDIDPICSLGRLDTRWRACTRRPARSVLASVPAVYLTHAIPASSRRSQPLKANSQTFRPLPSPGTIHSRRLSLQAYRQVLSNRLLAKPFSFDPYANGAVRAINAA